MKKLLQSKIHLKTRTLSICGGDLLANKPDITLFPNFVGDVAILQVFKAAQSQKAKKNWFKRKLGFGRANTQTSTLNQTPAFKSNSIL